MNPILEPVPAHDAPLPEFVIRRRMLTPGQCDRVIYEAGLRSRFYRTDGRALAKRVDIAYIYPDRARWLFNKVAKLAAAKNVWRLALSAITEPIRIQRYRRGDYSDIHSDYDQSACDRSKLTLIVPLVEPSTWDGGSLKIGNNLAVPRLERGDAVIFPSFAPHRVDRVTRGTRIILSAWVSGPALR